MERHREGLEPNGMIEEEGCRVGRKIEDGVGRGRVGNVGRGYGWESRVVYNGGERHKEEVA